MSKRSSTGGRPGRQGAAKRVARREVLREYAAAAAQGRIRNLPASLYAPPRSARAGEVKCVDVAAGNIIVPMAGIVTWIPMPQEGSSFYNRIGRRIRAKSLEVKGYVYNTLTNTSAKNELNYMRFMVVYDRQVNGANPSFSDVIQAYNNAGGTTNTALDGMNMNNRDRFMILRDWKIVLPPVGVAGVATTYSDGIVTQASAKEDRGSLNFHDYIKLKGLETQFKGTSNPSVVGDVSTGAYFFVACTFDETSPANPAWGIKVATRFKFLD